MTDVERKNIVDKIDNIANIVIPDMYEKYKYMFENDEKRESDIAIIIIDSINTYRRKIMGVLK